jgi:ATP-dependent DNA helicase RecG
MESQNLEYKVAWRDEYLKWICGFANASGGKLLIGVDDKGYFKGIQNYKELLVTLPNKIRDTIGIHAQINLIETHQIYCIEIEVLPYDTPISYKGKYYLRIGSTLQELHGLSLYEFLLKKTGKSWDSIAEPNATTDDIDTNSVKTFITDIKKTGRIDIEDNLSLELLLEKLNLTDGKYLRRAAIALFAKTPSRFFPNTSVKIGRFGISDADLLYHQVIEGNLIQQKDQIIDTLNSKFFIHPIEFAGIQRIEKTEYPIAAVREMILNALIHRNYMGAPTQIRLYDNSFGIWNDGLLPDGMTVEDLKTTHRSKPRNPFIADICFKAGYIDSWGRGTLRIIESCFENEMPEPLLEEQQGGFFCQLFRRIPEIISEENKILHKFESSYGEITEKLRRSYGEVTLNILLLLHQNPKIRTNDIAFETGKSQSTIEKTIKKMKDAHLIERIGSDRAGYWQITINKQ